jgi:NADP-dependent 3-hydroxy-3-methylglutaryl-CoA reductase
MTLGADVEALRVPARGRYDEAARQERLAWLGARAGAALDPLAPMRLDAARLAGNVENAIGAVEVPVGVAGPLLFRGRAARGVLYAPFATTEGALVASASRGATAVTAAGGVRTRVLAQRMTRAPVFEFGGVGEAARFAEWVAAQLPALRARVREVSRHARLVAVTPVVIGRAAHVLFAYTTGDAAGQNMTTAATWHAMRWALDQLPALGLHPARALVEGNLSGDKKLCLAAAPRGHAVRAACVLDGATLRRWLKVDAAGLLAAHALLRAGADRAGMVGRCVNAANVVAAVFAATGQDVACVHESARAELALAPAPGGGVRARLDLPGLVLGTVGGGTHLPAQRALLALMGCTGDGSAARLAEVVAGFALALDLSTLAALATGEFAAAHERLGRNRPRLPFAEAELDAAFLAPGLRRSLGDPALAVERVEVLGAGPGASIVGEAVSRRLGRAAGVVHRRVHHTGRAGSGHTDVVVKLRATDAEVHLTLQGLAAACGPRVADAFARHHEAAGFAGCHLRELAVYEQADPRVRRHVPRLYRAVRDERRGAYALVLERLDAAGGACLMDSADDPGAWGAAELEAALRGAGALHAVWFGRERALLARPWIGVPTTAARAAAARPLWAALAEHGAEALPDLAAPERWRRHRALVDRLPEVWAALERMPRTLAHGDFNPRNVALRAHDGARVLCAYDWELAALHVPQRDAAELLAFVLPPDVERAEALHWVERHRQALAAHAPGAAVPDARAWRAGFALALADLLVTRFGLYLMGHASRPHAFLPRCLATAHRLLDLELDRP